MTRIRETLSEMAQDLYEIGVIDKTTLRHFDPTSLPPVPQYTPRQISALRNHLGVSQPVFAAYLNVSDRAVKKWERGESQPNGATLRLLSIVERGGLEAICG